MGTQGTRLCGAACAVPPVLCRLCCTISCHHLLPPPAISCHLLPPPAASCYLLLLPPRIMEVSRISRMAGHLFARVAWPACMRHCRNSSLALNRSPSRKRALPSWSSPRSVPAFSPELSRRGLQVACVRVALDLYFYALRTLRPSRHGHVHGHVLFVSREPLLYPHDDGMINKDGACAVESTRAAGYYCSCTGPGR